MTKKETFVAIKGILNEIGNTEFDAFIEHEVELLSRKRTGSTKPTKRQVENEAIKAQILKVLNDETGITVTEIITALGNDELTNQRVSALLRQMGDEKGTGEVHKEIVKGKALFTRN